MKNIYIKSVICLLAGLSLLACKKENELSFSPNTNKQEIKVGEQYQLKVNSFGVKDDTPYAVNSVEWSIANTFVATIDANGVVTGKKVGTTVACGKFGDGKVVYADIVVVSANNQYSEPLRNSNYMAVLTYEQTLTKNETDIRDTVRTVKNKYMIYRQSKEGRADQLVLYFFKPVNYSIVILKSGEFENVYNKFLPDRYTLESEGKFVDKDGKPILAVSETYDAGVYYDMASVDSIADLLGRYKADASAYMNAVADNGSYTPEALGLKLPFNITATGDTISMISALNEAAQTYLADPAHLSFAGCEDAVDLAAANITDLYMQIARKWGLETWCWTFHTKPINGGLSDGHIEENYTEVAWARVLDLDALAVASFDAAKTFKELDIAVQQSGIQYYDIATLKDVNKWVKSTEDAYTSAEKKQQANYSVWCWAEISSLKSQAINTMLNVDYSYNRLNELQKATKVADFTKSTSYYADVPTLAKVEEYITALDILLAAYDMDDYTEANWQLMLKIYDDTKSGLNASVSIIGCDLLIATAEDAFDAVPVIVK
ncbi:MAG: Ig-like domain-containing protein [Paludibacteraceae bacterium]|nr:Ig-like domain-containing protein [Paludibacteraceae bacterium]